MIYPDLSLELPDDLGRVHFVGVGGSGMSGIAHMFHRAGIPITGSDRSDNYNTEDLRALGVDIFIGHDERNVGDIDTLVFTGALWEDNPEYLYAKAHGKQLLHRSHALAWLCRGKRTVSVAGAHGKTTTTGMIIEGLLALGADPSFVNGGIIESLGVGARAGEDDLFVIEADESDKSFLLYDTAIAVITNVDPEHLDFFGSREAFMQAFVEFANGARENVVISNDDSGAREVLRELDPERVMTFGETAGSDLLITDINVEREARLSLRYRAEEHTAQLRVFGRHNALNAAAAVAVLLQLGYELEPALDAVATFGGTKRRFELHADIDGVRVFDDYAHHPTEVEALLASVRPVVGDGRIIAVHQPHLYSRTKMFSKEFAEVLEAGADYTVVLAVDGAREDPVPGVTGALVAEKFRDPSRVTYLPDWQDAADHLAEIARPGDVMITMSCGSVYRIIPQIIEALEQRHV